MDILEMKKALFAGGVVGAGGAGFPTNAKLSEQTEVVILNCAECEPLIQVDRQLMGTYVEEILSGMEMIVKTIGAKEGIIAIKKTYTAAIEAVKVEIDEYAKLRLHILPDIYPVGDEVVLIYEATKRIVSQGQIPITVGCVVVNVETVLNIYNKIVLDKNVTEKYVTIAGEVHSPITVKVPVGTSVKEVVQLAGGLKNEESIMIMGGPMTGTITTMNDIVTKTTKAILVLPSNSLPVKKRRSNPQANLRNAMSACSGCQMCSSLCPRALLGQSIKPHEFMRAATNGMTHKVTPFLNSLYCSSCGLCEMYSCHQSLSPRRLLDACKMGLKSNGVKIPEQPVKHTVHPLRGERRVPEQRLVQRLGLHKYDKPAPLVKTDAKITEVKLLLRQSIGAPVEPCVSIGDTVETGQILGEPKAGALGTCLHASISGKISRITKNFITIKS